MWVCKGKPFVFLCKLKTLYLTFFISCRRPDALYTSSVPLTVRSPVGTSPGLSGRLPCSESVTRFPPRPKFPTHVTHVPLTRHILDIQWLSLRSLCLMKSFQLSHYTESFVVVSSAYPDSSCVQLRVFVDSSPTRCLSFTLAPCFRCYLLTARDPTLR